jgi:flagellin-like protein
MKQTSIGTLLTNLAVTGILSWGASIWLVRVGLPLPVSQTGLIGSLVVIAIVLVLVALPIFRYRAAIRAAIEKPTEKRPPIKRVDPFFAFRVALLSKASAISGAVFAGCHIGVLVAVLSSPQVVSGSVWREAAGLVGSLALAASGMVVERACKVPPDSGAGAEGKADSDASPA